MVCSLIHSHHCGRGLQYLADWMGYGPEERSWVSAWHTANTHIIWNFHRHPYQSSKTSTPRRVALQGTLSSLPSEVSDYGEGQEQPPSDQTVLAVILLMLREERLGWNFLMRILIFSKKIFYWFRVDFCPDNNVIHSCSYFPPFIFSSSLLASLYNYVKWSLCLESSRLMSICLFSWIWRDLEWRVPVHQVVQKILCLFVDINYWWISCECYRFASSGGFIWMWMRHYKVVEMTAKLQ